MVVYYAMTKFHLLFSLTHKQIENEGKKGVLFIYSGMQGVEEYRQKILQTEIFDEVYILDEIEMRSGWKGVKNDGDFETLTYDIKLMTDRFEKWMPVDINSAEKIYITNDHWAMGIYCIYKKIPYIFYEDGVGMLSKADYSYELVYKLNKTQAYMAKFMRAFGQNEYVVEKLADLENQSEGFKDEKAVHFSLQEQIERLNNEKRNLLMFIFDAPHIHLEKEKNAVLFTEHFVNMKRLQIEEQQEIYSLICDYFADGYSLIIKKHPNDIHTNYKKIFSDAEIISQNFPSELLPYCFDQKAQLGLAACSTAVLGLKKYFDLVIRFNIDIEKKYTKFHKYYTVAKLINDLNICINKKIGIDELQFEHFNNLQRQDDNVNNTVIEAVLVDEVSEYSETIIDNYDCTVFLNTSMLSLDFWKKYDSTKFVVIEIKKNCRQRCFLLDKKIEYIFIYCKNEKIKRKFEGIKFMKNLPYTGVILDVDNIADDDKIKIKFLEAYLKSVNEKLDYYIDREKELLDEIKKQDKI